jgi:hypothetical protein
LPGKAASHKTKIYMAMKNFSIFVLFFCVSSFGGFAEGIPLDTVMTTEEQKNCGIDTLTPGQKSGLEEWLGKWTETCVRESPSHLPGQSLKEWIANWPLSVSRTKKASTEQIVAERKSLNKIIFRVSGNGEVIDLEDGSSWKIVPYDASKTRLWQKGDCVEWVSTGFAFPQYHLTNNTRRQERDVTQFDISGADASQIKPPSATGQREKESEEQYAGSVRVTYIHYLGDYVELADKTNWNIGLTDQDRVKRWKIGDRIRSGKTGDLLYPDSLENLDSGDTVKAYPKRK